jgi:thiazole synthase
MQQDPPLIIAGKPYKSRLILGTGKYKTLELMKEALLAAAPAMVTVAVRRVDLSDKSSQSFWKFLPERLPILPNTAGCYTAEDAIRTAHLAREALETNLIKLEVIGDPKSLFPDVQATLDATRVLVKEGFTVLPYTNDDPIMARRLEDAGASTIMPLASPIGSGRGILNSLPVQLILEQAKVPVIVDAGVGTASDAAVAMELGAAGVLMNTAVAEATDPVAMALAMKLGVEAGRLAFLAGRMTKKIYASASSPSMGMSLPSNKLTAS